MSTCRLAVSFCLVLFCVFTLQAKQTSAATIETIAGDLIHGEVISLDEHHLKLQSPLLGTLRLDRTCVARITLLDTKPKPHKVEQTTSKGTVTTKLTEREFSELSPRAMADVIEDMCKAGIMDEAVRLLRQVPARKASKCLGEILDASLVAEIAERYRELPRQH